MDAVVPNLEELLKNLNHQFALYRQLVDIVRAERECIVGVKVKELRELTYSKEALVDEIQREETRRQFWLKDAAKSLGLKPSELTMDIVAAKFAPERYEAMMSLKNALVVLVKKIK
jgi:flagellar biosynthesis/type III secretory pathway chaperone